MATVTLAGLHRFFRQVSESVSHACLLGGSVEPTPLHQWILIGLHARQEMSLRGDVLQVNGQTERLTGPNARERLFERLEWARIQAKSWPQEKQAHGLPMAGGLMGCLGYEFYRWCDEGWQVQARKGAGQDNAWPELIFCEYEDWLLVHLESQALVVLSESATRQAVYRALWAQCAFEEAETPLVESAADVGMPDLETYLQTFEASFSSDDFANGVERLKTDIYNGEIYQANLSIRLQKQLAIDPYCLFERLCQRNPSPFSGFFKWPGGVVVSNSPERLVQMDEQGLAQTRPIAGTRGRGQTAEEDGAIGESLLNNEKERAEHLMLVDLARNDLGRVCRAGSVQVNDLLVLERYSHVTHLVSNVVGRLQPKATGWQLLQSLFPGGTITGCPKIRCVEILSRLEKAPRGFYTGSLGYLDAASPALDFNILIRSVFLQPVASAPQMGAVVYNTAVHVGAGIVYDAVGLHEYRECLRKATASLNELARLEATAVDARLFS